MGVITNKKITAENPSSIIISQNKLQFVNVNSIHLLVGQYDNYEKFKKSVKFSWNNLYSSFNNSILVMPIRSSATEKLK